MKKKIAGHIVISLLFFSFTAVKAQMITGIWKGKINGQKAELKIIQHGDSLAGSSYYYESGNNYRRYSIKGYFDTETNEAVWWDDQLIEERSGRYSLSAPGKNALLSSADFNCPGNNIMTLNGKAVSKENERKPKGEVHLDKTGTALFKDEWDFVIDNYTTGANDPEIIDSISGLAQHSTIFTAPEKTIPEEKTIAVTAPPVQKPVEKVEPVKEEAAPAIKTTDPVKIPTIEEKFITRKKILTKEIPVTGDSIELRFYDNGEIDGDSISLFLNDKLIFQHIRLAAAAYTIRLAVSELKESNELIMVAENLGSIPPNTSYMVAIVGDKQYDARLESTEGSSAMIRFIKKPSL